MDVDPRDSRQEQRVPHEPPVTLELEKMRSSGFSAAALLLFDATEDSRPSYPVRARGAGRAEVGARGRSWDSGGKDLRPVLYAQQRESKSSPK